MASPYVPNVTSPSCGNTINLDNLHFTPDELRSLNELIVLAFLESPKIETLTTVYRGIKNDKRIGLIPGKFGLVGKAAQGCDPVPHCYEIEASEKTWEPKYLEVILDICITELTDSLMRLALNCGIDVYDLTKTQIATFLLDRFSPAINDMIFRYAWFGDTAAANFPGGVITPGVDVTFFNVLNGYWQQLAVIAAADASRQTALPGNDQLTYALQLSVATPVLMANAINNMIDAAVPELAMQPDRMILVTQSVMQRLRRFLQALGTVFQDYKLMTNGLEVANWDGIPIYSIPMWDQMIQAYENNGTYWNYPHRALYTSKSNLALGMVCTSLFENINFFYDQRSRYNRLEATDAFDMKIIDDRLVQIGM